ncbi:MULTISPECIES: tetratricopeptide repeat protein [Burkholderia]|uniref:tetratricopeptide repeat protein n=1 Tax=Burkholderia TaxID=32008 RepID=UPI00190900AA|nr:MULTISPECIES: tetratricopeptide repeat protein [Burkholderia]MBJ9920684.1 sel1 repeat family protein [Burkholderia cenocepacia]MCA8180604.1 sel1 repeat family protein [Burkholderia vietnamiensis]UVS90939.1 sel1 repeat family protein [Burkholderia glumae]
MSSFQEQIDQAIKAQDLYFIGDQLPSDWYAGFKAWLPLAEGGDARAMLNVGYCYLRGEGVDRSTTTGLDWYRRAANQGDTRAMLTLYHQLKARTPAEAEGFLQRAASDGDERAIEAMKERIAEQQRQAQQQETEERERNATRRATTAFQEIKALLDRRDLVGARQRAEAAVQDGFTWAGQIIAALALKIEVVRTSEKHYTPGPMFIRNGNSYHSGTSHRTYTVSGTVTNPTRYGVHASIGGLGLGYGLVPANGSVKASSVPMRQIASDWCAKVDVMITDKVVKSLTPNGVVAVPLDPGQVTVTSGDPLPWKVIVWGIGIVVVLLALVVLH